jgi:tetratricopeptide (TPR) repeat protein
VLFGASTLNAQTSQLGKVEFPTSGSPQAQALFLRGLAALHSFWYEEALEAFRESTRIDPDFMMGYWGEAMAYNHPLWSEQDTPAGKIVVAKIKDTARLTPRERAYLDAVKLLYAAGEKSARDVAYSAAMEKIYRDYPDDLDAAAFYSLSLLGLVQPGDKGFRLQARAGAIALEVYQKNPNHPGAAHYIIHAFDDPEHAILALPAARRYAEIAPEAHHARHMPSHIFLQLGMWPEAAVSNESAWESSDAWMKRKHLSVNVRDYHSLNWLLYVYLQQGRYRKAEELLTL